MNQKYLGDSYDIVKRFLAEGLRPIAPLFADSRFIPEMISASYSLVTAMPILNPKGLLPQKPFGILLDPNTGIPLPSGLVQYTTVKHASLDYIVRIYDELNPEYLICFDQSYHRKHELSKPKQKDKKRKYLLGFGLYSFYFESQAPFLFISRKPEVLDSIRKWLLSMGIPDSRINPTNNLQWNP
jgi:hypothetical protein